MKDIEELQRRLTAATDFMEPWSFFHDRLASSQAFMNLGQPATDAVLNQSLEQIASRVLHREVHLKDPAAIHISEHGMWHGLGQLGDRMAIWFYFTTTDKGLMGLSRDLLDGRVELVRFSRVLLDAPGGKRLLD